MILENHKQGIDAKPSMTRSNNDDTDYTNPINIEEGDEKYDASFIVDLVDGFSDDFEPQDRILSTVNNMFWDKMQQKSDYVMGMHAAFEEEKKALDSNTKSATLTPQLRNHLDSSREQLHNNATQSLSSTQMIPQDAPKSPMSIRSAWESSPA